MSVELNLWIRNSLFLKFHTEKENTQNVLQEFCDSFRALSFQITQSFSSHTRKVRAGTTNTLSFVKFWVVCLLAFCNKNNPCRSTEDHLIEEEW